MKPAPSSLLVVWITIAASVTAKTDQQVLGNNGDEIDHHQGQSSGPPNPLDERFEEFVVGQLEDFHVPGLAVAVVDRYGEDIWAAGYGNASVPPEPVTPKTLFYGGSTTKAFTAALLSQLIDSGTHPSLTWRTPISSLIHDDFVLQPSYLWAQEHLTLEDALSHRTGFPRHDKSLASSYGPDGHETTMRDLTRSLRYLPMVEEPRTTYRYCNLMFMVVSHVLQTLTGQWLGTTMKEWIWKPLGMNSTYFTLEDALHSPEKLAVGYYWDYHDKEFRKVPFLGLNEAGGAGAIVSNVLDYAKWITCLLNEAPPLSKKGHEEVKKPRMVVGSGKGFDAPLSYALGWNAGTYKGRRVYSHAGGMEAYGAEVLFFPDVGYGVVTLGNTAMTSNHVGKIVAWKLIGDRLGVPEEERFDWAATGKESLEKAFERIDSAVETLYPDRADSPLPYTLPLEDYVGTYYHPAYQNITIELAESSPAHPRLKGKKIELKAVRKKLAWPETFDFQHVSGEYWVIYIDMLDTPNWLNGQVAKAEFRVGCSGKAEVLVVEFLEDGSEGLIVFERVAGPS